MKDDWTEGEYRIAVVGAIFPYLILGLIFFIGVLKSCLEPEEVPQDNSVTGVTKCDHYTDPNPKIEKPAEYFDFLTEQGTQYISHPDIYYYASSDKRICRYRKHNAINDMPETGGRFSHLPGTERMH